MRTLLFLVSLLASISNGPYLFADYILNVNRVGPESVQPNSEVAFDVHLILTDSNELSAFSLFFDISEPVGNGLPSGLGSITVSDYLTGFNSSLGNGVDTDLAALFSTTNFDFSVNAIGSAVDIAAIAQVRLFRLTINVGDAAPGEYSLLFRDDPIVDGDSIRSSFPPLTGNGAFGSLDSGSVVSSNFSVVPEPGSFSIGCAAALFFGAFARRRRVSTDF